VILIVANHANIRENFKKRLVGSRLAVHDFVATYYHEVVAAYQVAAPTVVLILDDEAKRSMKEPNNVIVGLHKDHPETPIVYCVLKLDEEYLRWVEPKVEVVFQGNRQGTWDVTQIVRALRDLSDGKGKVQVKPPVEAEITVPAANFEARAKEELENTRPVEEARPREEAPTPKLKGEEVVSGEHRAPFAATESEEANPSDTAASRIEAMGSRLLGSVSSLSMPNPFARRNGNGATKESPQVAVTPVPTPAITPLIEEAAPALVSVTPTPPAEETPPVTQPIALPATPVTPLVEEVIPAPTPIEEAAPTPSAEETPVTPQPITLPATPVTPLVEEVIPTPTVTPTATATDDDADTATVSSALSTTAAIEVAAPPTVASRLPRGLGRGRATPPPPPTPRIERIDFPQRAVIGVFALSHGAGATYWASRIANWLVERGSTTYVAYDGSHDVTFDRDLSSRIQIAIPALAEREDCVELAQLDYSYVVIDFGSPFDIDQMGNPRGSMVDSRDIVSELRACTACVCVNFVSPYSVAKRQYVSRLRLEGAIYLERREHLPPVDELMAELFGMARQRSRGIML